MILAEFMDANHDHIYHKYISRIGKLVSGTVERFERGDIIIDLGHKVEAILPRSQQARTERWVQGGRMRAVIINVYERKRPQVEVSRTSAELLRRLFEQEVPEIDAGTVVIKSAAREPGERAKIAVMS